MTWRTGFTIWCTKASVEVLTWSSDGSIDESPHSNSDRGYCANTLVLAIHAKQLLSSTPLDSHKKSKPLWILAVTDAPDLIAGKIRTNFERHDGIWRCTIIILAKFQWSGGCWGGGPTTVGALTGLKAIAGFASKIRSSSLRVWPLLLYLFLDQNLKGRYLMGLTAF
jgi:hypothetical protein